MPSHASGATASSSDATLDSPSQEGLYSHSDDLLRLHQFSGGSEVSLPNPPAMTDSSHSLFFSSLFSAPASTASTTTSSTSATPTTTASASEAPGAAVPSLEASLREGEGGSVASSVSTIDLGLQSGGLVLSLPHPAGAQEPILRSLHEQQLHRQVPLLAVPPLPFPLSLQLPGPVASGVPHSCSGTFTPSPSPVGGMVDHRFMSLPAATAVAAAAAAAVSAAAAAAAAQPTIPPPMEDAAVTVVAASAPPPLQVTSSSAMLVGGSGCGGTSLGLMDGTHLPHSIFFGASSPVGSSSGDSTAVPTSAGSVIGIGIGGGVGAGAAAGAGAGAILPSIAPAIARSLSPTEQFRPHAAEVPGPSAADFGGSLEDVAAMNSSGMHLVSDPLPSRQGGQQQQQLLPGHHYLQQQRDSDALQQQQQQQQQKEQDTAVEVTALEVEPERPETPPPVAGVEMKGNTPWTPEEDERLREAVARHSLKNWKKIARHVPGRSAVQCLQHYKHVLHPSIERGSWTPEEISWVDIY